VDLDPKVTALLNPTSDVKGIVYPDPKAPRQVLPPDDLKALKDPRMHFVYTDGRFFVKTTKEHFDVIFVNLPPPSTAMLNRYYTREFFEEARRILNPGGVVALTIPSAANYIGDIVGNEGGSIFHTVRDVFAGRAPEAKRYVALSGGDTAYLFASDAPDVVTMDPSVLAKRFTARKVDVPLFSPELFPQTIMQSRVELAWDSFMSRKDVPRNTDLRPVTYYYNLRRWDAAAGSKLQPVFSVVGRFNIGLLIAVVAGLLALRLGYALLPPRYQGVLEVVTACVVGVLLLGAAYGMLYAAEHAIAAAIAAVFIILFCVMWVVAAIRRVRTATCGAQFNYLTVIAVCGFSSMAFELILVFAFQNLYGFLYYQIGLIIALFMVGLAVGGLVSNLLVRKGRAGVRALMGVELAMAAYGCLLPPALTMFSARVMVHMPIVFSQAIFMSFILVAGALGGFVFPLVTGLYFKIVASTGMTAGKVDSADHVGACVGSLMAGTVLVPIIGIGASSIFVAFLNLACAFLLVAQAGRGGWNGRG